MLRIGICAKFRICSFTVLYSFAHGAQIDHQADGELLKGGEVGDVLEERAMRQEEREIGKRPSLFDEAQALGLQRLPRVALEPLNHAEVTETANRVKGQFRNLLDRIIEKM